jgi:hypothetical protein
MVPVMKTGFLKSLVTMKKSVYIEQDYLPEVL